MLSPGERHEQAYLEAVLDGGAVKRVGRGRPRIRPSAVAGDKGYSSPRARQTLRRRGIRAIIPRRRNQRRAGGFDRDGYRERNVVERTINRLKQFRRMATRYEKRAVNYQAMVTIASIMLWL